jgi:uncharacterized membrane protein YphA (DoxX/SURF4 family)
MVLSFAAFFAAAVFLASGLGKFTARGAVSSFIEQLGMPKRWLPAISTIIPVAEITLGLLLASGIAIRAAALVSAVVAAGFLAAHLLSMVRGNTAACRCFGTLDTALRPAVSAIRAGMFLAATIALAVLAAGSAAEVTPATVAGGLMAAVSYIVVFHLINETATLVGRDRRIHEGLIAAAERLDRA